MREKRSNSIGKKQFFLLFTRGEAGRIKYIDKIEGKNRFSPQITVMAKRYKIDHEMGNIERIKFRYKFGDGRKVEGCGPIHDKF